MADQFASSVLPVLHQLRGRLNDDWAAVRGKGETGKPQPVTIEQLLTEAGDDIQLSDDHILELIYEEICLREAVDWEVTPEDYAQRFPRFADQLRLLFQSHEKLKKPEPANPILDDTSMSPLMETVSVNPTSGHPENDKHGDENDVDRFAETLAPQASKVSAKPDQHVANRYQVVKPHATGGLGEVSVARDLELHRNVALKELKDQFADDPESRSRFVQEAEVTGALEHPGVVPVYGLGHFSDGRPYYAMRFIEGDTLKEAADRLHESDMSFESVAFRKLMGHFVDICNAIEYAHSRGVLHRDLKPGNVMLGKYGETLVVDWGLAKVQGSQEDSPSEYPAPHVATGAGDVATQMGFVVGTPSFMPPEQASGDLNQLGPPSDVYSLGATLYYLLTKQAPFSASSLVELLENVKAGRLVAPRMHKETLPKPLESICLKAMSTLPADRYASPRELADDVECYLADEPVRAHAEPIGIRVRRWLRKHPRTVATVAATVMVSLVSSVAISAIIYGKNEQLDESNGKLDLAVTELKATNEALVKSNEAEQAAKVLAQSKREEAESVLDFFQAKVLAAARPQNQSGGLGIHATIRQAIDAAEPDIAESFKDQPLAEAAIRSTVGITYSHLTEHRLAIAQHQRSLELREEHSAPEDRETLVTMSLLADDYRAAGDLKRALSILKDNVPRMQAAFGLKDSDTHSSMNSLAGVYYAIGDHPLAVEKWQEVLDLQKTHLGVDHEDTLFTMNNLATGHMAMGSLIEAAKMLEEVAKGFAARFGAEHPDTLSVKNNLAQCLASLPGEENRNRAISILVETVRLSEKKLGPGNQETIRRLNNLAQQLQATDPQQAIATYEKALQRADDKLAKDHPLRLMIKINAANFYLRLGNAPKADSLSSGLLELCREKFGPDHRATYLTLSLRGSLHRRAGRLDRAIPMFKEALASAEKNFGPEHEDTLVGKYTLALAQLEMGLIDEAIRDFKQILAAKSETSLIQQMRFECSRSLARAYKAKRDYPAAIALYEQILKSQTETLGDRHRESLKTMGWLANAYSVTGDFDKAIPLAQRSLEGMKSGLGPRDRDTLAAMVTMVHIYRAAGKFDLAVPLSVEALRLHKEFLGADQGDTLSVLEHSATTHYMAGKKTKAIELLEEALALRRAKLPEDSSEILRGMTVLGSFYIGIDQYQKGVELMEAALERQRRVLTTRHPDSQRTMSSLMRAYFKRVESVEKAYKLSQEILAINRRRVGNDAPDLARALARFADGFYKLKAYDKAAEYLAESLKIRQKQIPDHWQVDNTKSLLGAAYAGQKEYGKAEPLLLEGFAGLSKKAATLPAGGDQRIRETLRSLVDLYSSWNKPDKAAEWQKKLDQIK